MKKLLSILLIVLCTSAVSAQNFWQDYPYLNMRKSDGTYTKSYVFTEGLFSYGCDGVNNEFLNKMYTGGFLDSSFIEKSANPLLPSNRFGVHTQIGIQYGQFVNDSSREMLNVALLNRNSITGRFSDDAFRLAFQGNTRFKGEEADFSRTRFTYMNWTQLRIGYSTPQPHGFVSFSFSLLAGHHYNQANIEYGKLYTDSQGQSLSASVGADYWSSDTANTSTYALNGFGTSVDISWLYMKELPRGNLHSFKIDLFDFGFINWNDKTIHQYVDTTFDWYGVDVTPYFIDPDYVAELPEENDFVKSDTNEFHRSIFLPALMRGTYTRTFSNARFIMKASAALPLWSEALPYGSLTGTWKSQTLKTAFTAGVAYGGYARLQVPVKLEVFALGQSCIEVGTTNALAFIAPADIAGGGAFVKLSYCFR